MPWNLLDLMGALAPTRLLLAVPRECPRGPAGASRGTFLVVPREDFGSAGASRGSSSLRWCLGSVYVDLPVSREERPSSQVHPSRGA